VVFCSKVICITTTHTIAKGGHVKHLHWVIEYATLTVNVVSHELAYLILLGSLD
jgi:hypothetical protein